MRALVADGNLQGPEANVLDDYTLLDYTLLDYTQLDYTLLD